MADIYLRSTDGDDADDGSTWALAKATLAGAAAVAVAGDTVFVSSNHAENGAASISPTWAGTPSNPIKILSVDDTGNPEPPTTLLAGASFTSTEGVFELNGSIYCFGLNGASHGKPAVGKAQNHCTQLRSCHINQTRVDATTINIEIGPSNYASQGDITIWDSTYTVHNADHGFRLSMTKTTLTNFTFVNDGVQPNNIFRTLGEYVRGRGDVIYRDSDLSAHKAGVNIVGTGYGTVIMYNCKLPIGWNGALFAGTFTANNGTRISMYSCDSGDTNYRIKIATFAGTIDDEITLVRTGGATDGDTPWALKLATSAGANEYVAPLVTDELLIRGTVAGTPVTATVEFLHDSLTNLQDDEIWLEVNYLGTSGVPLGTTETDRRATILTTPADQATSAEVWTTTGMTNPNKQKLSVTFTPQEKGMYVARVFVGKPSYTVYVDPTVTIS